MTMPVVFVAHGAPPLLDDAAWVRELGAWGRALPRPQAILMMSAHWEQAPLAIGATAPVPPIYDFGGFPARFYQLQYPAPGAPALASRVRELMAAAGRPCVDGRDLLPAGSAAGGRRGVVDAPARGHDHGIYIPLMCMFPAADLPLLQISLPTLEPRALLEVGRALAPLRDEGVLIAGSGFLTHNLRTLGMTTTPAWARDFDAWCEDVLARHDDAALLDYRARAPGVREALPTHEHFAPVIFAAGAAGDAPVAFPITGFWMGGTMTKRSVQWG